MVDFGVGMGPNGQIGPVMVFTGGGGSSEPESYESHYETDEGIAIKVVYQTKNKVLADEYSDTIAKLTKWKILEKAPEAPMSLAGELAMGWGIGAIAVVVLGFLAFLAVLAIAAHKHVDWDTQDAWISSIPYYCAWAFPTLSLLINLGTLTNELLDRRN